MSKKGGIPSGKPLYPTQQSAAAAYPTQSAQPPPYAYAQATAPGAPPPYTGQPYGAPMYGQPQPYAQPYGVPTGPQPYAQPPGVPVAQPYYGQQYAPGAHTTVVVQGGFDAGARFDGASRPNIPPPPPGCAPNAAQLAAAQGCQLVVTQRPNDLFMGGSDGGYSMF